MTRAGVINIGDNQDPAIDTHQLELLSFDSPNHESSTSLPTNSNFTSISQTPEFLQYQYLLTSEHTRARIEGIKQLICSGQTEAIAIACKIGLSDDDSHVRTATCQALTNANLSAVDEALLGSLRDPDPKVRWSAADALSGTLNPKALRALIGEGLVDPVPEVRKAALNALLISQSTQRVLQNIDLSQLAESRAPHSSSSDVSL